MLIVKQVTSPCVAILVSKRAPNDANGPPGASSARRSDSSINSCRVTTVGYPIRCASIGVSKPDTLSHGDLPKALAPKLNQMRSGLKLLTRDKMPDRAFGKPG